MIDAALGFGLFRTHVRGRAEQGTFARQAYSLGVLIRFVELGQAEIHQFGVQDSAFARGNEDVFGF